MRRGQRVAIVPDGATAREIEPSGARLEAEETVGGLRPRFVRLEVREGEAAVAFSNPVYFWPEPPEGGVPSARQP